MLCVLVPTVLIVVACKVKHGIDSRLQDKCLVAFTYGKLVVTFPFVGSKMWGPSYRKENEGNLSFMSKS